MRKELPEGQLFFCDSHILVLMQTGYYNLLEKGGFLEKMRKKKSFSLTFGRFQL